jgi:cytidylate kinase
VSPEPAAAAGRRPVIAIDGPSGVGKSTAARRLARRLGLPYLDTGAMYRALALAVLDAGADPGDRAAVAAIAEGADLRIAPAADGGLEVLLDGAPAGERIRTPRIGEASSVIAAYPEVRRRLVALQRAGGEAHGGVIEGRDIGSRVFPGTPHKFFLTAPPEVRHRRRWEERRAAGRAASWDEVVAEIEGRDRRDAERSESPLTFDASYIVIDTSELTADEVVDRIADAVGARA